MVRMKDIAECLGVSVSTVSLVLNGRDSGRVKPHIAERVRTAAREMGYRPNAMARGLRTSHSHVLGFISVEVATAPFAGGIILGAQDAASELGYLVLTASTKDQQSEIRGIDELKRYGVDGFIYAHMSNRVSELPKSLVDVPLVMADATTNPTVPCIVPDEVRIGYDATNHLIKAGCQRIAYVGCSDPLVAQLGRLEGYRRALKEACIDFKPALTQDVLFGQAAMDGVSALFERTSPDGVFCFNDARTWYVYQMAAARGMHIGEDLSVIGVDNHRIFDETCAPALTTIELPHYEMGYWAARKLVSMVDPDALRDCPARPTTAVLPSLDTPAPATIHCKLIRKMSVRGDAGKASW